MKIEIRKGKRGESHKFMVLIGGKLCMGANTIAALAGRIARELELEFGESKK